MHSPTSCHRRQTRLITPSNILPGRSPDSQGIPYRGEGVTPPQGRVQGPSLCPIVRTGPATLIRSCTLISLLGFVYDRYLSLNIWREKLSLCEWRLSVVVSGRGVSFLLASLKGSERDGHKRGVRLYLGSFFFIVVIVIILWPDMSVGRNGDILLCDECVMGIFFLF